MLRRLGVTNLPEGDALSLEQETGGVYLREVVEADLADFYEHQQDPVANQMAAFPPRDPDAFLAHWRKILADDEVAKRTVLLGSQIAGNIVSWEKEGELLVGYWLGTRFWGQGIATRALSEFISSISKRPLYAHVAKSNVASIRVLEKCGFHVTGESRAPAPTGGDAVEEFIYSLMRTMSDIRA
jgi:RimJ/RimL family protein N-acetyltransferase